MKVYTEFKNTLGLKQEFNIAERLVYFSKNRFHFKLISRFVNEMIAGLDADYEVLSKCGKACEINKSFWNEETEGCVACYASCQTNYDGPPIETKALVAEKDEIARKVLSYNTVKLFCENSETYVHLLFLEIYCKGNKLEKHGLVNCVAKVWKHFLNIYNAQGDKLYGKLGYIMEVERCQRQKNF